MVSDLRVQKIRTPSPHQDMLKVTYYENGGGYFILGPYNTDPTI